MKLISRYTKTATKKRSRVFGVMASLLMLTAISASQVVNAAAPTVITGDSVDITRETATLNGSAPGSGGKQILQTGFEYGTTESYGETVSVISDLYEYHSQFGWNPNLDGQMKTPDDIAIDSLNNVYVIDPGNSRVQKFNAAGVYQSQFGSNGSGDGQFAYPSGITIDNSDNIYVADTGNNRVQKFNAVGVYQSQFGSNGSGDGQFNQPKDIALDSANNIYVLDTGNSRVQKFNAAGVYQSQFGSNGSSDGQFTYPWYLTTDSQDNIYVSDTNGHRIQKFDPSGNFITKWGSYGSSDGKFTGAVGITADSSDNIYVADRLNSRIQKFDSSGNFITKWGGRGSGAGQLDEPRGLVTDSSDSVYLVDSFNNRVQKFNAAGVYQSQFGRDPSANGSFKSPHAVIADDSDNIYVLDSSNSRIQKFDPSGNFITKFGSQGSGDGQFSYPHGIDFGPAGDIYVLDTFNHRIQKFDSSGNFITKWGSHGSSDGKFAYPNGVTVDSSGNVFVLDTNNSRIQKFDPSGNFITKFGSQGSGDGQFNGPKGIALDSANNIYVLDTGNNRVQKFNAAGVYQSQFGSYGTGDGQFNAPAGITIDSLDNIFISNLYNDNVMMFDSSGEYISGFGSVGTGDGEFNDPTSVAVDSSSNIYVADSDNHRIQKFAPIDGTGDFAGDIENLTCGTTYHYRAYAGNSDGISNGPDATFDTAACPLPFDLSVSGYRITPMSIKSGDQISYSITVSNLGPGDYEAGNYNLYINIPETVSFDDAQVDDVADYECTNLGPVQDSLPTAYTGDLAYCGIYLGFNVPANGETTLTLNLTATSDFAVGEDILSMFLLAGDTDTQALYEAVGNGDELFEVQNNNVLKLIYGVNDDKPSDTDQDSVTDTVEDAAPNGGDGNKDGVLDSKQKNVTSRPNPRTGKYVTLVAPTGTTLTQTSIYQENVDGKTNNDTDYDYPLGLISFTLTGVEEGSTNEVTIYYSDPDETDTNNYVLRKHNYKNGDIFSIDDATLQLTKIDNTPTIAATYQVKDGGKLDLDGEANGTIVDPVGLGVVDKSGDALAKTGLNVNMLIVASLVMIGFGSLNIVSNKAALNRPS